MKVHPDTVNSRQIRGESYKEIDKLQIGDLVLSANEHTGELSYRPITELFVHDVKLIHRLTYKEGLTIETTWNHPFWVQDKGWTEAKDLHAGERSVTARSILKGKQPRLQTVSFTSNVQPGYDDPSMLTWDDAREGTLAVARVEEVHRADKVYNIEVEGNHTYFVTEEGVLVHNYDPNADPYLDRERSAKVIEDYQAKSDGVMEEIKFTQQELAECRAESGDCGEYQKYLVELDLSLKSYQLKQKIEETKIAALDEQCGATNSGSCAKVDELRKQNAELEKNKQVSVLAKTEDGAVLPIKEGEKYRISSGYGPRSGGFHDGLDIKVPVGTSVLSTQDGKVLYVNTANKNRSYGYVVVVKGDDGTATLYAHNSKVLVKEGDTVHKGQEIAKSGNTGKSTGPHIHYEVIKPDAGKPVQWNDHYFPAPATRVKNGTQNQARPGRVDPLKAQKSEGQ